MSSETSNSDSSSLIEREAIANTPFTLIKKEEQGWFISWGNYKLTENQPTKEEAASLLDSNLWDIIAVYTIAVVTQMETVREQEMKKRIEKYNTPENKEAIIKAVTE